MTKYSKPKNEELFHHTSSGDVLNPPISTVFPMEDTPTSRRPESQLLGRSIEIALSALPDIPAPSLEGLSVKVPPPQPMTEEHFSDRLQALQLEYAHLEPRMPGDLVRQGDLVVLDVIGYAQQRILPFSTRRGLRGVIQTKPDSSGFFESLMGLPVGEAVVIPLQISSTFPLQPFRGEWASFAVDIVEAYDVRLLDFNQADEVARLGMGDTIDEVLASLLEQIEEEMTESLLRRAARLVMNGLAEKVSVPISSKLIDKEIREHWLKREGLFLQESEIEAEDMEASLSSWLHHNRLRQEVQQRLTFAVLLRSIAEQSAPPIGENELDEFIYGLAGGLGLSPEEARVSLQQEPKTFQQIIDKFVVLRTLEFVMAQTQIEFLDNGAETFGSQKERN